MATGGSWRRDGGSRLPPGTRVAVRAGPERHGTVARVLRDHGADHYLVRWDDGAVGELREAALVPE
jgi:Domain of unknown function (DUF1918)